MTGTDNPDLLDITPIGYNGDLRSALRPGTGGLAVDNNGRGDQGASSGARNFSAGEAMRFDFGSLANHQELFGNRAEIVFGQFDPVFDSEDEDIEVKLYQGNHVLETLSFDLGSGTTVTAIDHLFEKFDAMAVKFLPPNRDRFLESGVRIWGNY